MTPRRFPPPWSVEEQGASNRQMWPRLHQQDKVGGPKTLGNATPVDVVVPPVVGGPEQGWPVNGFVPVDRLGMLGAGETGVSRPAATVFPLRIGLTVFPLRSGLLVFCASAIVVVALRTRTLRPISAMRFTAMSDLLVVAPDTNRNTSDFLDYPEDKRRRLSRQAAHQRRGAADRSQYRQAAGVADKALSMPNRRFPPPWSVEETPSVRFGFCVDCLFSQLSIKA
jgi:hypothetical protein